MFESLNEAITKKKAKVTPPKQQDIPEITVEDVKQNLPNFTLEEFDTIDDELLANLVYEEPQEDTNMTSVPSSNAINTVVTSTVTNTQSKVLNFNRMPNLPQMPAMYFPHSAVTINYNFKQ